MDIADTATWTDAALEEFLERVYKAGRIAQSIGSRNPHFILPARNKAARQQFENVILNYFSKQYGIAAATHMVDPMVSTDGVSIFRFQSHNVCLVLMDC